MDFKLVVDSNLELVETPIWDERVKKLYWTDLFSGDVFAYDPATGENKTYKTGRIIGSAVPSKSDPGRLMVVIEGGLHVLDLASGKMTFVADPDKGNANNRYNDSRCDAKGRVFMSSVSKKYGTPDYQPDMLGDFFMVDTDGSCKTIVAGINQYNAMVWNGDNTKMYVVDTYHQKLLCFDYDLDKGPVSGPREVIDFAQQGMPDGMSIDVEDNLYVCHWTGIITVWDKNLQLVKTISFPVEFACCGGFAGADMKDFYVASSKYCYNAEQLAANPGAGGLFMGRNDIAGRPDHFYL